VNLAQAASKKEDEEEDEDDRATPWTGNLVQAAPPPLQNMNNNSCPGRRPCQLQDCYLSKVYLPQDLEQDVATK
jgi:hypothetical protein